MSLKQQSRKPKNKEAAGSPSPKHQLRPKFSSSAQRSRRAELTAPPARLQRFWPRLQSSSRSRAPPLPEPRGLCRCVRGGTVKTDTFSKRASTPKSHTLARSALPPRRSPPLPTPEAPGTHGHGLQRLHDDPVDLVEQLAGHLLAAGALEVEPQVADRPLAPVDVVVVLLATGKGAGRAVQARNLPLLSASPAWGGPGALGLPHLRVLKMQSPLGIRSGRFQDPLRTPKFSGA